MKTIRIENWCPKCGVLLPANSPKGLCPKCLLAVASAPTESGPPAERWLAPSLESVQAAFPQLEIIEILGQGGMGVVYKARQPRLDRFVALKLLPQSLAADAAFAERFNREARVLARLNHPNIVTVHDFGNSGGFFFLLMEFVDGVNLRKAMQAGRFTPMQALTLVPKVCEALQFAHEEGILHRDIKPENILLDAKGRVKIADFGIAKLLGEPSPVTKLTATGAFIGTPNYMAPEQMEHPEDVDQRADIYSLGVVFYEMLTGELPIGRFAPPSEKSTADPRVDAVVFRALEREREKRFSSAGEVKTRVEELQTPSPSLQGSTSPAAKPPGPSPKRLSRTRTRWSLPAVAGVALLMASLVILVLWVNRRGQDTISALIVSGVSDRSVTLEVTTPPRETLTVTCVVRSNGVQVGNYDLRTDLPAPSGQSGQFKVEWRLLDEGNSSPDRAPWEVLVEDKRSGSVAARLRPKDLPGLTWTVSKDAQHTAMNSGFPEFHDVEVARALQSAGGVSALMIDWSVRLALGNSIIPPLGLIRGGIGAQFTVPAGQVAVFEVVTRSNQATVPIPNLAGFVVAAVEQPSSGTFRWVRETDHQTDSSDRESWKIEIIVAGGKVSSGGLDFPAALLPAVGAQFLGLDLKPDRETVHWKISDADNLPDNGLVGLRVRTRGHGLKAGMLGSAGSVGTGTNWLNATSPPEGNPRN